MARGLENKGERAKALSAFVPRLPEVLPEVLEAVRAIQDRRERAEVLGGLVSHLNPSLVNFTLWKEILHTLASRRREDFLGDILALSPAIVALGGSEALREVALAIQAVGRWWP